MLVMEKHTIWDRVARGVGGLTLMFLENQCAVGLQNIIYIYRKYLMCNLV